jgi:hypothetical protein
MRVQPDHIGTPPEPRDGDSSDDSPDDPPDEPPPVPVEDSAPAVTRSPYVSQEEKT